MEMDWWDTTTTVPHSGLAILLLLNLPRLTHNHILNESQLSWNSSQWPKNILHRYTHRGNHSYLYLWVPGYLYVECYSMICGTTYKPHGWDIYHWNSSIWIHNLFCEYEHCQMVQSFFYQFRVFSQGHFYWYILHIMEPPLFYGFVVLRHNISLPHHWWPAPY